MKYYLAKADPDHDYGIDDLARDGTTNWDGVHNNAAILFIKQMEIGDRVFIYHSQKQRAVVGLAEVISEPYENTNDPRRSWSVTLKYVTKFSTPVHLTSFKANPEFITFSLVRESRLSVMPVPNDIAQWIMDRSSM